MDNHTNHYLDLPSGKKSSRCPSSCPASSFLSFNKMKRILPLILCFVLILAVFVGASTETVKSIEPDGVFPDTGGEIREIVLQYSYDLKDEVLPAYRDFLLKLGNETEIHIVCENDELKGDMEGYLAEWQVTGSERIHLVTLGGKITVWARDRFVIKRCGNKTVAVLPALNDEEDELRINDQKVPYMIKPLRTGRFNVELSNVWFEGGNIVADEKYAFTGYATIRCMDCSSDEDRLKLLGNILGREVVVLGEEDRLEPTDHVDMYLTPLGNKTVLLGNPSMAYKILMTDPEYPEQYESLKPSKDELDSFERVREQLEEKGFRVVPIPYIQAFTDSVFTYNNSLLETLDGKSLVYLPVYNIDVLDKAAIRVYSALGFEVRTVDVSKIYIHGGTIRCLTNVIARGPLDKKKRPRWVSGNEKKREVVKTGPATRENAGGF